MLYQEAKTVSSFNLAMMGAGIGLICGGCSLVGKRKTIKKKYDVPRIVAHRFLPLLRKARQLPSHHGQHHQRMRDAGCDVAPHWARGAKLVVPFTVEQVEYAEKLTCAQQAATRVHLLARLVVCRRLAASRWCE